VGDPVAGDPDVLIWTAHPARERPLAAAALLVIMLAASLFASWFGGSPWWGLVGFFLLCLSMWSFLLPTTYRMDETGVAKKSAFGTERKTWKEVRSFTADSRGVLLSPFPNPTPLAKFRGLSVQFSSGNREEVIAYIRDRYLGRPVS
jgi:hypothetical protein